MLKKVFYLLIILGLVLCISSCDLFRKPQEEHIPDEEENVEETLGNMRRTVFYFSNDNDLLVPVVQDIPWVEGIGKSALQCLVDSPELRIKLSEKGLRPTLPEGTELVGMTIRDGLAKVDFNSAFLDFPSEKAELNGINSVIYTLTEFPTVDKVQILVNGMSLEKGHHGSNLAGIFDRKNINMETSVSADKTVPVTLYFKGSNHDGNFTYFVPVTRMVVETDNLIKTAIEELVKGPQSPGLASILPKDTKVLDVVQRDSEVVVDFSKEIEGYGGGVDVEQSLVDSVVLTVSQFPGVEKVSLLVDGKAGALPEGTTLDSPIFKPVYINADTL